MGKINLLFTQSDVFGISEVQFCWIWAKCSEARYASVICCYATLECQGHYTIHGSSSFAMIFSRSVTKGGMSLSTVFQTMSRSMS